MAEFAFLAYYKDPPQDRQHVSLLTIFTTDVVDFDVFFERVEYFYRLTIVKEFKSDNAESVWAPLH